MGLDSTTTNGMEICADTIQYIDFTTMPMNYKWRLFDDATHNDFEFCVNGNASPLLTLNNTTLTANIIPCGAISCTGLATKLTTPTVEGVFIGMDNSSAGGIQICSTTSQHTDFTYTSISYKKDDIC